MRATWIYVAALILLLAPAALAGEYYLSDEDAYWWYWDGTPNYEVLIPSRGFSYVQVDWSGQTTLYVTLKDKGPLLIVGTAPGTDVQKLWQAMTAPWAHLLNNPRTTQDTEITTDQGLRARFLVLSGSASGGPAAMIRLVAFTARAGRHTSCLWATSGSMPATFASTGFEPCIVSAGAKHDALWVFFRPAPLARGICFAATSPVSATTPARMGDRA